MIIIHILLHIYNEYIELFGREQNKSFIAKIFSFPLSFVQMNKKKSEKKRHEVKTKFTKMMKKKKK